MANVSLVRLLSDECPGMLLMPSQYWFRQWLGAVREQAITWANVDLDLCHHMTTLGHNELISLKEYIPYTRRDTTVIIDATAWGRVLNIAELFTLGAMSPWYNNFCRKFPWRHQRPSSGLVLGFGVISHAGAIKWVQESYLVACHYDTHNIAPYCDQCKQPSWFLCNPFSASIAPQHRATLSCPV